MDQSPFGKLPAELRNEVYELVLQHSGIIQIKQGLSFFAPCRAIDNAAVSQTMALTRVCKQIHDEAAPIFYALNSFDFWCPSTRFAVSRTIKQFSSTIGLQNAASLRDCSIALEFQTGFGNTGNISQLESTGLPLMLADAYQLNRAMPSCRLQVHLKFVLDIDDVCFFSISLDMEDPTDDLLQLIKQIEEFTRKNMTVSRVLTEKAFIGVKLLVVMLPRCWRRARIIARMLEAGKQAMT